MTLNHFAPNRFKELILNAMRGGFGDIFRSLLASQTHLC
jgi:hypothetical protein